MLVMAAAAAFSGTDGDTSPGSTTVGTFNIHYIASWQTDLIWEDRREAVVEAVRDGGADIIGFQEMETFARGHWNRRNLQLDWILDRFSEYDAGAVGDPRFFPSTQPILYRSDSFELIEQGFFFFSAQPDIIYSQSWNGGSPGFCSWVRLLDLNTEEAFYVYNLHFDSGSRRNRIRSARLVAQRIETRAHGEDPVIVVGDFNASRFYGPVKILRDAGLAMESPAGGTYHFGRGVNFLPAIDHILFSSEFSERQTSVIRRRVDGVWASDHHPVFTVLERSEAID